MRKPLPAVHVFLGPSRVACAMIVLLALTVFFVVVAMPIPWLAIAGAACVIFGWAAERVWVVGLRRGERAVRAVQLDGHDNVTVHYRNGRSSGGSLCTSSRVGPRLATVVWRARGSYRSGSVLILPDMLAPDAFRELRVLMRYGRSDDSHASPASHA